MSNTVTAVTDKDKAIAKLIEVIRKNLCHLPVYTHPTIIEAIENVEKTK